MRLTVPISIMAAGTVLASIALAASPEPMPWVLYRDGGAAENHGVWQTVQAPGSSVAIEQRETTAPAEGASNVRLEFVVPPPKGWAGVVVLPYPDAWGISPGYGYDLSAAQHLVFMARGEGGGESVRVKTAVAGDQPYGDSAPLPFDSGWLNLSDQWQTFVVDVDGSRLSHVITPLVVICNHQHNPSGRVTVHLDFIRFETGSATRRE